MKKLLIFAMLLTFSTLSYSQIGMMARKNQMPFISTWVTTGSPETVTLPLLSSGGQYDFVVDWGDGTTERITTNSASHSYAVSGTQTIRIKGLINGWRFNNSGDNRKITDISQWGCLKGAGESAFRGCYKLNVSATDPLNTDGITDFSYQFFNCTILTTLDVSNWDVSSGTNFSRQFYGTSLTTLDVGNWDVSSGTDFSYQFGQLIGLSTLDVSNWDVSSGTDFSYQFDNCRGLTTLDVSGWDVSEGLDFSWQFNQCTGLISLDVSNWNVAKGTDFSWQFYNCSSLLTLDVSDWEVEAGLDFSWQFANCTGLTSLDVSNWNVEKGTNFSSQFLNCSGLNVIDVSIWNVVEGQDFRQQFEGCTNLTGLDVSNWNVISAIRFDSFMNGFPGMTTPVYNQTLINWKDKLQSVTGSPNIDFGGSKYTAPTSDAATARAAIETLGWTITDGGGI
jgi:surface protein